MYELVRPIDDLLNRITMYRLTVYGLSLLLVAGFVFGLTGDLGISESGLAASTVILVAVCYATNHLLARLFHAAANSESWLISALILALILPPLNGFGRIWLIALTGILAIASKYILAYRAKHLFNPAAAAAFLVSVFHILPVTWWIGSPSMLPFSILVGLLIVRKIRKFQFVTTFIFFSIATMALVTATDGLSITGAIHDLFLSWPMIFMGTIMLTEPSTTPPTRYYQLLTAAIVGIIFTSQITLGPMATTPQFALLAGNIMAYAFSPRYKLRLKLRKRQRIASHMYEYLFDLPAGIKPVYAAGQYMEWTVPHGKPDSRGNRRTFSLASSPTEQVLRIAIKEPEQGSSFKQALAHLQPDATVLAGQTAGNFVLSDTTDKPLVWIAGGIGITPFRSMAKYLIDSEQKRDINLFYLSHTPDEFIYQDVFSAAVTNGLQTHYISDGSRLEVQHLTDIIERDATWYIAGPQGMVAYYQAILIRNGVKPYRIVTDYFSGY